MADLQIRIQRHGRVEREPVRPHTSRALITTTPLYFKKSLLTVTKYIRRLAVIGRFISQASQVTGTFSLCTLSEAFAFFTDRVCYHLW